MLKNLIFRLLIFVGIVAAAFFISFYLASKTGEINEEIRTTRQKLVNFNYTAQSLLRLEKDIQDARAFKALLDKALPTRDALLARQPELNILARKSGLLQSVAFSSEIKASETSLGSFAANFQIVGSLTDLIKYIKVLEEEILISINYFDFSATDDINNPDTHITINAVIPVR